MNETVGAEQIVAPPATIPPQRYLSVADAFSTVCLHTPFVHDRDRQRHHTRCSEAGRHH
jgi:hypothetical protein